MTVSDRPSSVAPVDGVRPSGRVGDVDPADPVDRSGRFDAWRRPLVVGASVSAASTAAGALVAAMAAVDSPVAAVAGVVIDNVPGPVRRWAISTFGTSDKLALGVGIVVILGLVAGAVAVAAQRRRWVLLVAIVGFAGLGLAAADELGPGSLLSALASALAAYVVYLVLLPFVGGRRRRVPVELPVTTTPATPMVVHRWDAPVDRRQFVARTGALWAGTAVVGGIAAAVNRSDNASVVTARAKFPKVVPGTPDAAAAIPAGASVGNGELPFITSNDDFYRIDTSFIAPRVTLDDWRLEITGAVDNPLSLSYDDLLGRHVVERVLTMCCVSNEVGGDLIGTAKFLGVPLKELLEEAGVRPDEGSQVAMTSVDGWTCGFPTELALDGRDAIVAVGMNGEPLPVEHGFPVRLVVPGLYGYVSATKWLTKIELVGWDDFDGYWVPLGWSKEGPVKTQSRIDVPESGAGLAAGKVVFAGVAWAQHRGIEKVEVRVDDGEWAVADVGDEVSVDAWRQWIYEWDATPGDHRVYVRATDRNGDVQTADRAAPAPDGATGHHSVRFTVA